MEKIAAQGGWKEAEKTMTAMAKIKPASWKEMGETIDTLKDFVEGGAVGGLQTIGADFQKTISLKVEEMLSPLLNEVTTAVDTALAPIMPLIQETMTGLAEQFSLGMGAIQALLSGNFDVWLVDQTVKFQKGIDSWSDEWKKFHLEVQKIRTAWDKVLGGIAKDWEAFWSDPLGGLGDVIGIDPGVQSLFEDIGAGWSGFWSDVGSWF